MALGNKEIMAKNIKKYMAIKGVNQTEMCNALGFKFMTLSDWLHAKTYPRSGICGRYGCDQRDFSCYSNNSPGFER